MTSRINAVAGLHLQDGLARGGAPVMWTRVIDEALPDVARAVPPGSRVLEVGYGDGLLTCWLAQRLEWRIIGLDSDRTAAAAATAAATRFGLDDRVTFLTCAAVDTRRHAGQYDAVFVKTVLYSSSTPAEYGAWLDWIRSVLRPGGALVNFETGRANGLVQVYRRLRRRSFVAQCLYTRAIERLYDARFEILARRYYGGLSQFLAPAPPLYRAAAWIEAGLAARTADNCFAVSIVARRRP